jgi:hypothetical protein
MSRIQITAKATTQGRKKQKQTLTTGDLLIENGLVGERWAISPIPTSGPRR